MAYIAFRDIDPRAQVLTVSETPAMAVLDGGRAIGHVAATKGMQLAIAKAREVGTGTVAVKNGQHFGAASVYALMAIEAGMIGYCTTSTAGATVAAGDGLPTIVEEELEGAAAYERDRARIDSALDHIGRTALYLVLLALGPALALLTATWAIFGRERSTGYDREYEQEPPSDLAPALVPSLLSQGGEAGSNEFTGNVSSHNGKRGFDVVGASFNTFLRNVAVGNDHGGFVVSAGARKNTLRENTACLNDPVDATEERQGPSSNANHWIQNLFCAPSF